MPGPMDAQEAQRAAIARMNAAAGRMLVVRQAIEQAVAAGAVEGMSQPAAMILLGMAHDALGGERCVVNVGDPDVKIALQELLGLYVPRTNPIWQWVDFINQPLEEQPLPEGGQISDEAHEQALMDLEEGSFEGDAGAGV